MAVGESHMKLGMISRSTGKHCNCHVFGTFLYQTDKKNQPFVSYRLDPSLWDRDWIKMIEPSMSRQSVVQGTEALSLSQWQHLAGEVVQLVHSTHLK